MPRPLKILDSKFFLSLLAIFSGLILPLAFAPFGYYLTAELSLIILLLVWFRSAAAGQAFWYGCLFGMGFFGAGVYWVYISIHHYGHAPIVLAVLILLLLISFLALYPALQGYFLHRCYGNNSCSKFLLAFPISWVVLEWIRGWFLSGFPWLFLGYGHISSPLRGWAMVFGVYGVSFMIAQTAGAIFWLCCYRKNIKFTVFLMLSIIALWFFGGNLAKINWVHKIGEPIKVSLIQGNISQQQKWDPGELWSIMNSYTFLTAKNFTSKIIVWPEAAIPTYPENINSYLKPLSLIAAKRGVSILSGVPFYDQANNSYYNGILAYGAGSGRYYKRHLVPFGEYLPLKFFLKWLHNFLTIPMADFSSGVKNQPDLLVGKIILAPFVCYEIAYPGLVLDYLPRAQLMVTVSDDSWFGESIAAAQHLEIARMRSLEAGRYQLLATNTGITAVIDSQGVVVKELPIFQQGVLTAEVLAFDGKTPWIGYGQYLWLPLLFFGLGLAKWRDLKQEE